MNQVCLAVALGTSYIRLAKMHRPLGAYPIAGPVPYLTDDPLECRRLLEGQMPATRTWFHGTSETIAQLACVQGIRAWVLDRRGQRILQRNGIWRTERFFGPSASFVDR